MEFNYYVPDEIDVPGNKHWQQGFSLKLLALAEKETINTSKIGKGKTQKPPFDSDFLTSSQLDSKIQPLDISQL